MTHFEKLDVGGKKDAFFGTKMHQRAEKKEIVVCFGNNLIWKVPGIAFL